MGKFGHVFSRFMGFFVALHTNDGNVGIGQEFHGCRQHAETCAENRHQHRTIRKRYAVCGGERGRHFARASGDSASCFSNDY